MKIDTGLKDDFISNWGITSDSLDMLDNIEPAPEYELGSDYRTFYELPASSQDDEGWILFQDFIEGTVLKDIPEISYDEFLDWKKDDMKLGKYLSKQYLIAVQKYYGIENPINFKNNLFNNRYLEQLNTISTKRVKGQTRQIMLSQNPLDFIVCSNHTAFSSCMGLHKSYGIWHSIPTLIWNPNIAYIALIEEEETVYVLKNCYKIKVPKVKVRSWVYLMVDSEGNDLFLLPKQYPTNFLDVNVLRSKTGLNFVTEVPLGAKTKYRATFPVLSYNSSPTVFQPYFDLPLTIKNFDIKKYTYDIYRCRNSTTGSKAIKVVNFDFNSFPSVSIGGAYCENEY